MYYLISIMSLESWGINICNSKWGWTTPTENTIVHVFIHNIYLCTCRYVYVHVFMDIFYTWINIYMYIHVFIHMYICTYMYLYICIYAHTCIFSYMHVHVFMHGYTHIYIHTCLSFSFWYMYVCSSWWTI